MEGLDLSFWYEYENYLVNKTLKSSGFWFEREPM